MFFFPLLIFSNGLLLLLLLLMLTFPLYAVLWQEQAEFGHQSQHNAHVKTANIWQELARDDGGSGPMSTEPVHYRLERHLMAQYNNRLIPRRTSERPIQVLFTIGLYQIIEVNEPQQYVLLNSWIVERWHDDLLYWDADQFDGQREIVLPHESVWIPDTTLYNSLVMDDQHSRRILNVKLNTLQGERTTLVEMLYPTLYQFSCLLDLRFFPFDIQHCVMTFGSWSHDNKHIDYFAYDDISHAVMPARVNGSAPPHESTARGGISIEHCIPNEGWNILSTEVSRREVKFHCCANNYTLLEFKLHIQRKPLFYLVNLIVPTSIITLIAIVGFFSSSTVNDTRDEKISLGITTLLSMSILIFMVSDQMPSTSSFIPLIGWFYTSMMALISGGTLAASFVIYVQKKGIIGQRPSRQTMRWARRLGKIIWMEMPLMMKQAYAIKAKQDKIQKVRQQLELQYQKQLRRQQANGIGGGPHQLQQQCGTGMSPRKGTFWQLRNRIGGVGATGHEMAAQRPESLISQYRSSPMEQKLASTSFVGPTLGQAMAMLVPRNRPNPPAEGSGGGQLLLTQPAPMHSCAASINEEASDELEDESSEEDTTSAGSGKDIAKLVPNSEEATKPSESPNLIFMDEEAGGGGGEVIDAADQGNKISKEEQEVTEHGDDDEERRPRAKSTGQNPESGTLRPVRKHRSAPQSQRSPVAQPPQAQQVPGNTGGQNWHNPLVANAAVLEPLKRWAHKMLDTQRELERHRMQAEMEMRRRAKPAALHTRRSTSQQSMADLYAASLFAPTPAEPAQGTAAPAPDPGTTLAEASATLSALQPQVQRNLAEIEYDWLAAVVERMFLILFCTLFFLMSFGINGIGLYYWYFTYQDMIERS